MISFGFKTSGCRPIGLDIGHDSIKMIQLAARHSLLCRKFRGKFKRRRGAGQSDFVEGEGRGRRQKADDRKLGLKLGLIGFELGLFLLALFIVICS